MSSDSAKENASVVDSSVTEWKHDMGNSDDPGNETVQVLIIFSSCIVISLFYHAFDAYLLEMIVSWNGNHLLIGIYLGRSCISLGILS
jgi:hypothetical protein